MNSLRNHLIFIWTFAVITVVVSVTGLFVVKSPLTSSKIRSDEVRAQHARDIIAEIQTYYASQSQLPKTLSDLTKQSSTKDPETQETYSYRVITPTSYELCMTFQTQAGDTSYDFDSQSDPFVTHREGKVCANTTVESDQIDVTLSPLTTGSFQELKADLHINSLGEKSAIFDFQPPQMDSLYTVDVSTDPLFNDNIYLNFAQGSVIPVSTSEISYFDFTCGTTLYWRVYSKLNSMSEIKTSVVTCEN